MYGETSTMRSNTIGAETAFAVKMVKKFKLMKEIQFLLARYDKSQCNVLNDEARWQCTLFLSCWAVYTILGVLCIW